MSYITSSLSPYRSDNVWKEFAGILKEDYEWVCSSLKDRGLIFLIAFVILMSLSLLKTIKFPLKLAYGITIHKSQGMSLDKLVVDGARIFEKGQMYVALSRIRTLKVLYLINFDPNKIKVDEKVVNFYQNL